MWFYIYKAYLRLVHETLMVRNRYTIGLERLPREGEKYFIVCNHQNTANDPLNIMFALPLRIHTSALARADIFELHPLFTRFLHWIGLLPAFRLGWEGGEGIEQNFRSFDLVADRVLQGSPTMVFPEAGHTQGHYVGTFTTGVVRMAFRAAERSGWQEDIKIVPSAHHYSDFFDVRADILWQVGTPISLRPYYADYQQHPNSVLRTVKREMFRQVHDMMLDEGEQDYREKDFLRRSTLNIMRPPKPSPLPEQLEQDKAFARMLNSHPRYADIIGLTRQLIDAEQHVGADDDTIARRPTLMRLVPQVLAAIILLPLWVVSLWPHALCYGLPPLLLKTDIMFTNTYRYVVSVLFLYPLFAVLTILTAGIGFGMWWQSVLWLLLMLPLGQFCWWYYQRLLRLLHSFAYLLHRSELPAIHTLRSNIATLLAE